MIERYSRKVMRGVWTEQNKFQAYLEVEILSCEAWSQLGVIPKEDVDKIRAAATFDVDRIKEIEEITRHDVVAFTRAVSESLGPSASGSITDLPPPTSWTRPTAISSSRKSVVT